MRLKYWLFLGLAGVAACGTTEGGIVSGSGSASDSAGKKDGGARRDASAASDEDDVSDEDADEQVEETSTPPRRDGGVTRPGVDETCEKFSVPARANAPDILIVLDRSGSMVQGGRWNPSVAAIKKITTALEGGVSFGLMLYPEPAPGIAGIGFGLDANGTCGPGKVNVPFMPGNAAAIATKLNESPPGSTSQTPTAASLQAALEVVVEPACADCPRKSKYIVLVTDGQPNCGSNSGGTRPGSGGLGDDVTNTVKSIEALTAAEVKTYVVGYGTKQDQRLASAMDQFAKAGGTTQHYAVENEATFVEELTKIAGQIISCEYELTEEVSDPAYVRVTIDNESYVHGQDWILEDGKRVILQGAACAKLRDAKEHTLDITVECTPVQVL